MAFFYRHGVDPDPLVLWIMKRPARHQIELPPMPWAAPNLIVHAVDELTRLRFHHPPTDIAKGERCSTMGAFVSNRVQIARDINDPDRSLTNIDNPARAWR
jgi:hypothetical protein